MAIKAPVCDYENYDGVKYEDDKASFKRLTGPKSRLGFSNADMGKDWYDEIDWSKKSK